MKNRKLAISLISSACLSVMFVVFTLLVKFVDVAYVGMTGKEVGLSSFNRLVYESVDVSETFDKLGDVCMVLSILVVLFVVALGIYELVKNKSIKKVDKKIWSMGIIYALVVLIYVVFELICLNYRPVLIDGKLEASYPSSHVMLSLTILSCFLIFMLSKLKTKKQKAILGTLIGLFMFVIVLFRVLSGMHWMTDIIASVILALMLAGWYVFINCLFEKAGDKNGK